MQICTYNWRSTDADGDADVDTANRTCTSRYAKCQQSGAVKVKFMVPMIGMDGA